jgi:microcystin-dependent protein
MEEFIGTVKAFAFNFPPRGWQFCNGQIMSIAQNNALFAILGTTFGGNGQTTFGLPDLRGRTIVHPGQGPGLSNVNYGEVAGTEATSLTINNMPGHVHPIATGTGGQATLTVATVATAITGGTITNESDNGGNSFSSGGSTANVYSEPGGSGSGTSTINGIATTATLAGTTGLAGGSTPFSLRNPYLGIYMSICLEGVFPSRN